MCVLRPRSSSVDPDLVDSSEDEGLEALKPTKVDIDLGLSAYANACKYVLYRAIETLTHTDKVRRHLYQ